MPAPAPTPRTNAPALVFDNVTRTYGRRVALSGFSLRVEPGTVLGLVGRNGAGKTTALRLAHGILWPDSGSVRVLGLDPVKQGIEVRTRCSLLAEESALYPWMTVGEIVDFASKLHPRWDASVAASYMKRLELDAKAKIKTLSRGTKAKVALLLAVAVRPDLLLLDDPTAGLDPLVRREVLEGILEAIPGEGGAVVYASHMVTDLERIADRIAYIDGGRLQLSGTIDELKARIRRVSAVFDGGAPSALALPGALETRNEGRELVAVVDGGAALCAPALRAAGATSVEESPLPLEDILVACLRQRASDERDEVHHEVQRV